MFIIIILYDYIIKVEHENSSGSETPKMGVSVKEHPFKD